MAIENRNLAVGTRLVASYKKQTYVCTVEATEEGAGVLFALEGGKKFKSPSAAGSHIMGGKAVNGWRFWSVEGEAPAPRRRPRRRPHEAVRRPRARRGRRLGAVPQSPPRS
jgi:hypothetical protein